MYTRAHVYTTRIHTNVSAHSAWQVPGGVGAMCPYMCPICVLICVLTCVPNRVLICVLICWQFPGGVGAMIEVNVGAPIPLPQPKPLPLIPNPLLGYSVCL